VITAKLSDYKKDFKVALQVDDDQAPEQYELSSEISAGLFGKASAVSAVKLTCMGEADSVTRLEYQATISASGVIANGLPLVRNLAERRVREFFELFQQAI
jgi:carbon monoxide dehydrogenase subunit G